MIDLAAHLVLVLLLPPLILGVINKTKALFAGRVGPPFLQTYFDVWKLLRRGSVFSRTTTWMFRAGPLVALATVLFAALLVPLAGHAAPIAFEGDMIFLAYLLALGRFGTIAAALDTGSAFEGMGSAREATFAALAEPALFLCFVVLVRHSGSLSLSLMMQAGASGWGASGASIVLVVVALFIVLLAENSRIPVDDPNTHLELTMIHEVMVLDHSGPLLGAILYGAAVKLFLLGALVVGLVAPQLGLPTALAWPVFAVEMLLLGVVVGLVESMMARLRLSHVPSFLVAASLLAGFGVVLLVR